MNRKDYQIWWRQGWEIAEYFEEYDPSNLFYDEGHDDSDCMCEQLWAIREGLA